MSSLSAVFTFLTGILLVSANNLNDILFNGDYEFIDLTHPFDNKTVYWTNTQNFVYTKKTTDRFEDGNWYATNEFAAGEHGGTHFDAPYHFAEFGAKVGEIPLEKMIVPLIIVDVSEKVNGDPNFILYKHHLDYILNDNLGKPCLIIFKFGWSRFFGDRKKFLGLDDQEQKLNFPGVSGEVGEWITTSYKNVVGIGVDTASVDPGASEDYPVHKNSAKHGLYQLENVDLSRPVPEHGCTALVMPMKITEGTGAPLRVVAICPKKQPAKF